ncbi:hypothetical protein [Cupriavidus sp. H18C2]|uniref:hypothetical protein n=1 Tax=Cupriavidus sp. H18C2 TaxID=3241602 RepID=UPI003BF8812D
MDLHSIFLFDDGAKKFKPRPQVDANLQGMSWKLIRVSKPDREATGGPSQGSSRKEAEILAIGIREVPTLRGLARLEIVVQTLRGEKLCEMSAHDDGARGIKMTNGYLVIDEPALRGWRIASYCFNHIVAWAKRHFSDRDMVPIELEPGDAVGLNTLRRNKFYEQFGIHFVYAEKDGVADAIGESVPMKIGELIERTPDRFPNIEELDVRDTIAFATLLFPQAQRRVLELRKCVSDAVKQTTPSRRFIALFRYVNWLNCLLACWVGAMIMSAVNRLG